MTSTLYPFDLDAFDLKILAILQKDNQTPHRLIGEKVHLSAAAVQRRIKRMLDNGVITGNVAIIAPEKIGYPITLIVEVSLANERIDLLDEIKRTFDKAPEVQQCYYVTGDVDFVLIVNVPDMAEYEQVTRRLFFENQNIVKFRTMVAMGRVKTGLSVPIAE